MPGPAALMRYQRARLQIIDALPEFERRVTELHLHEGQSLKDIAETLDCDHSAVRRSWRAAARRLAEVEPLSPEHPTRLVEWSLAAVRQLCEPAWRRFDAELADHYSAYFADRPDQRDPQQAFSARTAKDALPAGCDSLLRRIEGDVHHHFRSGKSSQALALSLLGDAEKSDPQLGWLWEALDLDEPNGPPEPEFEKELARATLDESTGKPTTIDYFVKADHAVVCLEAKWAERGLGHCSCLSRGEADPERGQCSPRVWARKRYRETGEAIFGLPSDLRPELPCPVNLGYQAIRNAAAARTLAGRKRKAAFLLVYHEDNPYFNDAPDTGSWPGWPRVLRGSLTVRSKALNFTFKAISWQRLVKRLPLDEATLVWARDKHRLPV